MKLNSELFRFDNALLVVQRRVCIQIFPTGLFWHLDIFLVSDQLDQGGSLGTVAKKFSRT